MTLLFVESFGVDVKKWDFVSNLSRSTTITGRYGQVGVGLVGGDSTFYGEKNITASSQVFVGFANYCNNTNTTTNAGIVFFGDSGATSHLRVYCPTMTSIAVARTDSTVLATATIPVTMYQTWHWIEIAVTIADSGGTAVVKVDGVQYINFTGDTKNGGTATTIDKVRLGNITGSAAAATNYVGDFYIANSAGSVNNTLLGEVRVQALLPTGTGSVTGLTPTGSANNWDNVNDVPGVDTTYNGSPTATTRDTYATADTTLTGTVLGVQLATRMFKSDAGAASMKPALKSGATVAYGTSQTLLASATTYVDVKETDPNTSAAWTISNVNAIEVGAEVV